MLKTFFGTLPQICASTQSCHGALWTISSTSLLGVCSPLSTVGPYIDRYNHKQYDFMWHKQKHKFSVKNISQNTAPLFSHVISGSVIGKMSFHTERESSGRAFLVCVFLYSFRLLNQNSFHTGSIGKAFLLCVSSHELLGPLRGEIYFYTGSSGKAFLLCVFSHALLGALSEYNCFHNGNIGMAFLLCVFSRAFLGYLTR